MNTSLRFMLTVVRACLLLASLSVFATALAQQDSFQTLPVPTGSSPVASVLWHWTDESRQEGFSLQPNSFREITVQAWYPAANNGESSSQYAPFYQGWENVKGASQAEATPKQDVGLLPVILLSPGRGMPSHFYTSIAEDLASHGYFVAAINSPYIGRVAYPNGQIIHTSDKFDIPFETLIGPYEEVDKFFEEATQLGADDIRFALGKLDAMNRNDPSGHFTNRLDLTRLAAFGHSLGGRVIGEVVATDDRFLAYASMEGVPPREARKGGLDAAVLMLSSSDLPDIAQPNIRDVIALRRNDVYILTLEGYGHNSVTDLPLITPNDYEYSVDFNEGIATVRTILQLFYDEYLLGKNPSLFADSNLDRVEIEVFPKP